MLVKWDIAVRGFGEYGVQLKYLLAFVWVIQESDQNLLIIT